MNLIVAGMPGLFCMGAAGVVVEQSSPEMVEAGKVSVEEVEIAGTAPDYPSVRDLEMASERFITQLELDRAVKVAVLGSSLAEELF
jgi:putative ABC transport system permease protein